MTAKAAAAVSLYLGGVSAGVSAGAGVETDVAVDVDTGVGIAEQDALESAFADVEDDPGADGEISSFDDPDSVGGQ